jgi:formylglycine-generating enzyme required for sulfatase activity
MKKLQLLWLCFLLGCSQNKELLFTETLTVKNIPYTFVKVEGGNFQMGCTEKTLLQWYSKKMAPNSYDCYDDELPLHNDSVATFYIGTQKISYQQFKSFVEETNYQTTADQKEGVYFGLHDDFNPQLPYRKIPFEKVLYKDHGDGYVVYHGFVKGCNWQYDEGLYKRTVKDSEKPVLFISWRDAHAFCQWLSNKTGKKIRMPTDREWEYAARGGRYSQGYRCAGANFSNELGEDKILVENSELILWKHITPEKRIPNELGLYGMTEDLGEFCEDKWYLYKGSIAKIDKEEFEGYIIRGSNRVWYRGSEHPDSVRETTGFRVVFSE